MSSVLAVDRTIIRCPVRRIDEVVRLFRANNPFDVSSNRVLSLAFVVVSSSDGRNGSRG